MKPTNIRIVATALFLSVCGLGVGSTLLSSPAAARDNGGGGGGGGTSGPGGSAGGLDTSSVYGVHQYYSQRNGRAEVPPTAQPRLMPLKQPDLHKCEGAIRSLGKENGRRILVCDITR